MSSHRPGIHTGEEFGATERNLKRKRDEELAQYSGRNGQEETVYRDKSGRKMDMVSEYMKQKTSTEVQKKALEEAQQEWGKGTVQKQDRAERARDFEELRNEPFARSINDPKLERMRKEVVRDGDPMAEYFQMKKEKAQASSKIDPSTGRSTSNKPIYRGPNPTPNRFNIRPGYRWDAIDRSNGFEKRMLTKMNEKSAFNEDDYKWRVSDL